MPFKERSAEVAFNVSDAPAYCRLSDAKMSSGGAKTARFSDCQHVSDVMKFQLSSPEAQRFQRLLGSGCSWLVMMPVGYMDINNCYV